MKSWDILKSMGMSDKELKDFVNSQRRERYRLNKIKQQKFDMGINEYVPTYTPKKLLTRIQQTGETYSEATQSIREAQEAEREDIPNEVSDIIQEACHYGNAFRNYPTDETSAKHIYLRNKNNLNLINELNSITETLLRYISNDESDIIKAQYIPVLNEALNALDVIVYG